MKMNLSTVFIKNALHRSRMQGKFVQLVEESMLAAAAAVADPGGLAGWLLHQL